MAFLRAPDALRQFLYTYITIARSVLPGLFYFFFAIFPVRSPIDRKFPWLKWLLLFIGVCLDGGGIQYMESARLCPS